jgi:hypothetical protein
MGSMASPSRTGGRKTIIGGGAGVVATRNDSTDWIRDSTVCIRLGGAWYCSKLYYIYNARGDLSTIAGVVI